MHRIRNSYFIKRRLGTMAVLAAASVIAASACSAPDDSASQNVQGTSSQPTAPGEQRPASTDKGIVIGKQTLPVDVFKATILKKVAYAEAPSPQEATKQLGVRIQNVMSMNVSYQAISERGGAEATESLNRSLIAGGLMDNLGSRFNEVSDAPTDFMQFGTLAYNYNKKNIEANKDSSGNTTISKVLVSDMRITGTETDGYTVLADLIVTTLEGDVPASSATYKAEVHMKLDATKAWGYTGSHVYKANG